MACLYVGDRSSALLRIQSLGGTLFLWAHHRSITLCERRKGGDLSECSGIGQVPREVGNTLDLITSVSGKSEIKEQHLAEFQ